MAFREQVSAAVGALAADAESSDPESCGKLYTSCVADFDCRKEVQSSIGATLVPASKVRFSPGRCNSWGCRSGLAQWDATPIRGGAPARPRLTFG